MGMTTLTRRTVLRTAALATTVLTTPFVRSAAAAAVVAQGQDGAGLARQYRRALARPAAA